MPPASPPTVPASQRLRRLPGRSPTLRFSRAEASARLWMDDRDLVQETVRGSTQEIQRFAFADIQAMQIRHTVRGLVYNLVLTVSFALTLLITVAAPKAGPYRTVQLTGQDLRVSLYIAAPFVVLLLINTLRGPTCRTVLTTALGPQYMPSLSRMRPARRALRMIIARVEAAQGALRPDEAAQQVDIAQRAQRAAIPPAPAPGPVAPPPAAS